MATLHDPCRAGCCKTGIPGICYNKRDCDCHRDTDRHQIVADAWTDLQEGAW